MRLLLSRVAGAAAMLTFAAAVAVSAPVQRSLVAQSASLGLGPIHGSVPDALPRRGVSATPPPASTEPAVISHTSVAPISRPAAPAPPPAPRIAVGTGQWGLINQDRAANALPPLQWSPCLAAIAAQNATRMAAQGFISHTNGVYLDLGCHIGSRAGENVGYLSGGINDTQMNTIFMASPEHRANILGAYRYVGVAWVVSASGAYIAVEFS